MLLKKAPVCQFGQVLARSQAGNSKILLHSFDGCVRVAKQVDQEFTTVDLWEHVAHAFLDVTHQRANPSYEFNRPGRGRFDATEDIQQPWLPVTINPGLLQELVVIRPGADDIAAEIQDRLIQ